MVFLQQNHISLVGMNSILIVGLGNPGSQYSRTRHNVGFAALDTFASKLPQSKWQNKFHSDFQGPFSLPGSDTQFFLMKPLTFMNRSGIAVGEALAFYKLDPATQLLVVSDDVDLPEGVLRLRLRGGSGGHNGLKSIIAAAGGEGFTRLRLGVDRSAVAPTDAHVLAKLNAKEWEPYEILAQKAAEAIEKCLIMGFEKAMNEVNRT